jgi:hypothetical protein|nr:MAG TPA: Restriction endonuclease [Caudoviricetes sp.]
MISTEIFVFILAVLIAIVSTLCIALLGVVKRKGNGTKNGSTGEPAGKLYNDDAGQILNEPEAYMENHSEIHTPLQGSPTEKAIGDIQISLPMSEDGKPPILEHFAEGRFVDHLDKAIRGFFRDGGISVGSIQRSVGAGYTQAATYMDRLESAGVISGPGDSGDRKFFITEEEWEKVLRKKLLSYPYILEEVTVSKIISRLSDDVHILHSSSLQDVDRMDGTAFEYWCASILRSIGYEDVEVTPGSGDQGVDIIAKKEDVLFGFQCKCYSVDIGNTPIQEIYAGLRYYKLHVGCVITNRYFSAGAIELAKATNVILWDRGKLELILKKINETQ